MRICSSLPTNLFVILFLSLTNACLGTKESFNPHDLTALLGDLRSLESEEQKSILKSLSMPEDIIIGEESKKSILIRIDPQQNRDHPHQRKQNNDTDENYDLVQWYTTPSRTIEHHVERGKLESSIDNFSKVLNNKRDLKAQETSTYEDEHNHDSHEHNHEDHYHENPHHDDHYHVDHRHQGNSDVNDTPNEFTPYHNTEESDNHDGPSSDVFYKKLKLKKVRRNCTRSKSKKSQGWPDRSDTIVHSRSNNVPEMSHYEAKPYESVPALPEARFHDGPNLPNFPETYGKIEGFSGQHLHGIPRTHFFQYKDGEGINHYHLHNHHHIYTADGKKISLANGPTYRNLMNHFGKLKTMLSSPDSGNRYTLPHITDNYNSAINAGNHDSVPKPANDDSPKMGYHYTGNHESYGRKTYKRIYPRTRSSSGSGIDDGKSFGMEMFRYGAGQYGTDEFSSNEDKGRYPNEVSLGVDKTYPSSGEIYEPVRNKPNYNTPSSLEYNSDSPRAPYPHSGEYDSSYNNGEKDNKYNQNYEEKAPYTPAPPVRGGNTPGEYNSGYIPPSSDGPGYTDPYPEPFSHDDGKNELNGPSIHPPLEPSDNLTPQNPDVTHSISYSQDGQILPGIGNPGPSVGSLGPGVGGLGSGVGSLGPGIGSPINYGQENPHLFLRPEPDPLTIPKNARVFEHHIRLHPMHYNVYAGLGRTPINPIGNNPMIPIGRTPINYPTPYGNTAYPVPLHKLMPNPLKVPIVPPAASLYQNPFLNQMLQSYQGRSLHHRWW